MKKIIHNNQLITLNTGDRLVRTKGAIVTEHHAVYAEHGWVAENQTGAGVQYITLEQFLSEGKLTRVETFEGNPAQRKMILEDIKARIGWGYNLETYNCEHFVNDVLSGSPRSEQVKNAKLVGGLAVAAGVLLTLLGRRKLGVAIGLAGLGGLVGIRKY